MIRRVLVLFGAYWLFVGLWSFFLWADRVTGNRSGKALPPIDYDTWIRRPAMWMLGALILMLLVRIARQGHGPRLHRYGTARWNKALLDADLIKPAREGQPRPPQARMVGRVRTVDDTVLLTLRLPPGLSVGQVQARAERVAASVDVPPERLHLGRFEGRAGMLSVRIDPKPKPLTPRVVELPPKTSWRDPILLGRDSRGRDVRHSSWNNGLWLFGGRNGSGKTTALRLVVAHYALDPAARLWMVEGKGDSDDWDAIRPRTERFADIHDPNAPQEYLQMLRDVSAEVSVRNRTSGRDYPGLLLVLEEATAFHTYLDSAEVTEADRLLTRIVQTCRSANVLVLLSAQRPAATLLNTNVRAQANVGLCMMVRSVTDAEMILGYRPEVALPEETGRGLLDVGDGPRALWVDHMTQGEFQDFCAQWAPAASVQDAPLGADADGLPDDPSGVGGKEVHPLLSEVAHALVAAQRPLTAGDLWTRLPEDLRGPGAPMLGRSLSDLGLVARKYRHEGVQGRYYDLDALSLVLGTDLPQDGTAVQDGAVSTGL